MKQFTVDRDNAGQRLNKYCGRILSSSTQSFVYKMLRKKNITLNDKKADGSEILQNGDVIKFFLSDETFAKFSQDEKQQTMNSVSTPSLKSEEIIYEDENVLICYKPEGELSQKAKLDDLSINERIVSYLSYNSSNNSGVTFVPGICNRLDRNTKGLIVAGKNLKAQSFLCNLFKERKIDKYYIATVKGKFEGVLDSKLYLSKNNNDNFSTISKEKNTDSLPIHSVFYGIADNGEYSIIKIKLETGKSHQIRAQLSYLGYPIVGDYKYGDRVVNACVSPEYGIKTQMLLAYELVFPDCKEELPELSGKCVKCMIPFEFQKFWEDNQLWAHGNPEDLEVHF